MPETVFRRIHGRIVPIKSGGGKQLTETERAHAAKTGAAQVTAAAIVGAGGGAGVAGGVRRASSAIMKNRAKFKVNRKYAQAAGFGQMEFPGMGVTNAEARAGMKAAAKGSAIAKKVFKSRNLFLAAASVAAGSLLAAGAQNLESAARGKREEASGHKIAILQGAGAALTFGTYYKSLPIKGAGRLINNVVARMRGAKTGPHKADWWK